jgi:serine/threonine protein kinase/Tol biopolymer transport system component
MVDSGTRLGPYEILSHIGAGGMGEVYRARDTRLDRSVAVKILPGEFAHDAQLKLRFEREAKTISQLTHPNICTLYDVGSQDGVEFLVMELLDGESLAQRLARGRLPFEQALRVGIEVAEALERAHHAGIVHRDLKPGNVMLTKSGAKLLDFGLAKAAASPFAPSSGPTFAGSVILTEQKPLTEEGTIVGTFQYMAPEQIEGGDADVRTDIFALGSLLYEMVTGRRAFDGKSRASLMASILDRDPPPISSLQPIAPRSLDRIVRMCIQKDPAERWQSAHDVAAELRWIVAGDDGAARTSTHSPRMQRVAWSLAALLAVALAAVGAMFVRARNAPKTPIRFQILPPPNTTWTAFNSVSISPDGKDLVYFSSGVDPRGILFLRHIGSVDATPMAGTEDASFPFWSPDSKWVAFFTPGKLQRVSVGGGPPQVICEVADGRGGSWNEDGVVIFSASESGPIERVNASGGTPTRVLQLDASVHETRQTWPAFLPDGKHFVYRSAHAAQEFVTVASLDAGEPRHVVTAADAEVFAAPDLLLFVRQGVALAQHLDTRTFKLTGDAVPITEHLGFNATTGYTAFACSGNGTLVYRAGALAAVNQLAWFDRSGRQTSAIASASGDIGAPALSPDGKRMAYSAYDAPSNTTNVWIADLARGTSSRISFERGDSVDPVWSPDGTRVAYAWHKAALQGAVVQRLASGAGTPQVVMPLNDVEVTDWSPDGRFVIASRGRGPSAGDVVAIEVATGRMFAVTAGARGDWAGRLSPDGRWIAYDSYEGGRPEVYVQPFPPNGSKWQISTGGGFQPIWNRDGKEIFYLDPAGRLTSVTVSASAGRIDAATPVTMFQGPFTTSVDPFRHYDVSVDGKQFVFDPDVREKDALPMTVVVNWTSELPR